MSEVSDALVQVWAGNPVDEIRYQTLELINPAFTDEQGNPDSHRLVSVSHDPMIFGRGDGTQAEFEPGAFEVEYPEKGVSGRQEAKLNIDGASRRIVQQLERAADGERAPIKAVLREYVESDLMNPGLVYELTVVNPSVTPTRASATAVFVDPINQSFPSVLYTTETHPSLT